MNKPLLTTTLGICATIGCLGIANGQVPIKQINLVAAKQLELQTAADSNLTVAEPIAPSVLQPQAEPNAPVAVPTTEPEPAADAIEVDPMQRRIDQLSKPVTAININVAAGSKSPEDQAAANVSYETQFIAAAAHSQPRPRRYVTPAERAPLYFEQPNLERCGNGIGCLTPAASAMIFMSSALTVPYQMAAQPPCTIVCGAEDCGCCEQLPCHRPFQCKLRAYAAQGAATAGFVFLLL